MLKIDINTLFTVINLLILVAGMRIFLFKPVHKVLAERQKIVDQTIGDADAMKADAEALERQYRESMSGIEEQRTQILRQARDKVSAESDKILTEAKSKADKIVNDAAADAEQKRRAILDQAQTDISDIVLQTASKLMMSTGESSSDALYDNFLKKAGD